VDLEEDSVMNERRGAALLGIALEVLWVVLIGATGCGGGGGGAALPGDDPSKLTIRLRSSAFPEGGMIPKTYACDGADRSPPLEWTGVPEKARSLVLICDDPDAPMGTWSHWVLYGLSPSARSLDEGVVADPNSPTVRQGKNDFGKTGYRGPCPPSGTHRYVFRLFALDTMLDLGPAATRGEVLKAIEGHILAAGRLIGKYSRPR
jgi:Raf kinase inhibitor-like YbhB/YbcL family protein